MNYNQLTAKWSIINSENEYKGFRALRLSSECVCDLYIGMDRDIFRCLILFVPEGIEFSLKESQKENIELHFIQSKRAILIRLNDSTFQDLFNDLIFSLYMNIKDINDPEEYANQLIRGFHKWSKFFESRVDHRMSQEELKGFFGELFILNERLKNTLTSKIDEELIAWQGPYDITHDFIYDRVDIEVKSKNSDQAFVKISSEYQLNNDFDKGLELVVVSLLIDLINGQSLHDLLNAILKHIQEYNGDSTIFYNALRQKGVTLQNSVEYNNHRFLVERIQRYNCLQPSFPSLSISNIPEHITKLNYSLRVTALSEFLIEDKKHNHGT
jgi:hypothetical protein